VQQGGNEERIAAEVSVQVEGTGEAVRKGGTKERWVEKTAVRATKDADALGCQPNREGRAGGAGVRGVTVAAAGTAAVAGIEVEAAATEVAAAGTVGRVSETAMSVDGTLLAAAGTVEAAVGTAAASKGMKKAAVSEGMEEIAAEARVISQHTDWRQRWGGCRGVPASGRGPKYPYRGRNRGDPGAVHCRRGSSSRKRGKNGR